MTVRDGTVSLLPCPFCGSNGDTFFKPSPNSPTGFWWTVMCNDKCLAESGPASTEAEAIAAWNRRSVPSEPVAFIEPSDLEKLKSGESIVFYARDRDRLGIPLYPSPASKPEVTEAMTQPTHRHKKRGTEYVLIGIGEMQAEGWTYWDEEYRVQATVDMREVAIYRSATDPTEIWVRPREEFEDGRFEALEVSP